MDSYLYFTKHGIGPGTLPHDVELVKWEDKDDYITAIWTNRPLTTKELQEYDIYPETSDKHEQLKKKYNILESLTKEDFVMDNYSQSIKHDETKHNNIEIGKKYIYKYIKTNNEESDYDKELEAISSKKPICKVVDISDQNDYVEVDFDIEENKDKNLPYSGEYIVLPNELYELEEVSESQKTHSIFESLTDEDIEFLSQFNLDSEDTSALINLFELISEDNKQAALNIIEALFKGKHFEFDSESETSESFNNNMSAKISESYTRRLLGDI